MRKAPLEDPGAGVKGLQNEESVCGSSGLGWELELRLGEEGEYVGMIQCRVAEPGEVRKVSTWESKEPPWSKEGAHSGGHVAAAQQETLKPE